MDLANLERQLAELQKHYDDWQKPMRELNPNLVDEQKGYTHQDYAKDYDRAKEKQRTLYNPTEDILTLANQICRDYLISTSQEREEIRAFARNNGFFRSFLGRGVVKQLKSTKNQDWLRLGLAAVSIEDSITDFRDTLMTLAGLYLAAEEVGIDPNLHFQEVAQLSNDEPRTDSGSSTKKLLTEFHTLRILKVERENRQ